MKSQSTMKQSTAGTQEKGDKAKLTKEQRQRRGMVIRELKAAGFVKNKAYRRAYVKEHGFTTWIIRFAGATFTAEAQIGASTIVHWWEKSEGVWGLVKQPDHSTAITYEAPFFWQAFGQLITAVRAAVSSREAAILACSNDLVARMATLTTLARDMKTAAMTGNAAAESAFDSVVETVERAIEALIPLAKAAGVKVPAGYDDAGQAKKASRK